jgi:HK97 family phage major capsid protein
MKFDEMNTEELEAREAEILSELENRDAMDTDSLEARADELEAIKAELNDRKAKAEADAELRETVAGSNDPVMKTFESEEKKMFEVNSKEYRDIWLRNLQGNLTEAEQRDYSSSSTNAVPTIVSDKFFEKMKKLAPMLSEITLLRVAGNIQFVAEGTRNTATKHTENAALDASADTTVSVSLGGFEFMKVIKISRTAKLMSIDAFEGWLVDMLAGDIARKIDDYILNDATNGVAALTFTTNTNQILNTATTGYTYKNVCDLIALLPAAYDAEAKFLVNKATLYGGIAQIVDGSNRPIFVPDTVNGIGGRLMGYPVVVDDYVPTANHALYLGKWSDIVGNLPEDIHVDADESAGFTSNSIVYRGLAVFDSKPAKNDGIVRLVSTTA